MKTQPFINGLAECDMYIVTLSNLWEELGLTHHIDRRGYCEISSSGVNIINPETIA